MIITFNSIYSNVEEGIDLDDANHTGSTPNDLGDLDMGPNDFMNFPELTYASSIMASVFITGEIIDGLPNTQFEIQFFSNPACDLPSGHGEGKNYIGSSTQQTDGNGNVQFLVSLPGFVPPGTFITSTAPFFVLIFAYFLLKERITKTIKMAIDPKSSIGVCNIEV